MVSGFTHAGSFSYIELVKMLSRNQRGVKKERLLLIDQVVLVESD
jgi:hypothetical protein